MSPTVNHILKKTKDAFRTKWTPLSIVPPAWAYFIYTLGISLGSFSYAVALIVQASQSPISPLMAFAAVVGIPTWGILMLVALGVFIIGMLSGRSIGVSLGAALCMVVWFAFAATLGFGWFVLGDGGRFFIPVMLTAFAWLGIFYLQLRDIARNGV